MKKNIIFVGLVVIASLVFGYTTAPVYANPSQLQETKSSSATSTIAYMTPGTGTTTISIDTQGDGSFVAESALLAFQVTATSTGVVNPKVLVRFEDSMDGQDWYPRVNDNPMFPNSYASSQATTTSVTSDPYHELSFVVSTSTASANGFGGSGSATRIHYSIPTVVPLRYVRAILHVPSGGGNIGMWAEMVTRKQNR